MRPQTLKYGNGDEITLLEGTNTYLVHASKLQWSMLYPPTIFVEGIEDERTKFDFYKAYKNNKDEIVHCEYRSVHGGKFKLIAHTK